MSQYVIIHGRGHKQSAMEDPVTEKLHLVEGKNYLASITCVLFWHLKILVKDTKGSKAQPACMELMVWEAVYVICYKKILLRVIASIPEQHTEPVWAPLQRRYYNRQNACTGCFTEWALINISFSCDSSLQCYACLRGAYTPGSISLLLVIHHFPKSGKK